MASSLFSMMYTGVSGIIASQVNIDVTGHNIANIDNPDYSRQRANLSTVSTKNAAMPGPFGRGVRVEDITRIYDNLIANTLRNETSSLSYWSSVQVTLKEVLVYFNELENGSGLGSSLKSYYDAWGDLANTAPDNSDESAIKRYALLESANTLSENINQNRAAIETIRSQSDTRLQNYVNDINVMSKNMASINEKIVALEANGQNANDLRDARDAIAKKMSELAGVTVSERPNGEYAVIMAGQLIVDGKFANEIATQPNPKNDGHFDIVFKSASGKSDPIVLTDRINGGAIQGEIKARDGLLKDYVKDLDNMAKTLIYETNKIHVSGRGLQTFNQSTSTNKVENPHWVLSSEPGLYPYPVKEGSFRISVYDAQGKEVDSYDITIDPNELNAYGVAEKISMADGNADGGSIQASVNKDGTMSITAASGYTFAFGDDTSGFLVAAGFNNFFTGTDASNIAVEQTIKDNPDYIAASSTGAPGSNGNALKLVNSKHAPVNGLGNITIDQFYGFYVGKIAADKQQVDVFTASKKLTVSQYTAKLEEIKGVSMDEEMTNLAIFQRTFEANSRFVNTIDQMLDKVVNGLGLVGR